MTTANVGALRAERGPLNERPRLIRGRSSGATAYFLVTESANLALCITEVVLPLCGRAVTVIV